MSDKEKEIMQGNVLLAELLGFKRELNRLCDPKHKHNIQYGFHDLPHPLNGGFHYDDEDAIWISERELKFHSNWNWLMYVVDHIEKMEHNTIMDYYCFQEKNPQSFFISKTAEVKVIYKCAHSGNSKIESTWITCVEFAKLMVKLDKKKKRTKKTK